MPRSASLRWDSARVLWRPKSIIRTRVADALLFWGRLERNSWPLTLHISAGRKTMFTRRRSNITGLTGQVETPTFRALTWVEQPNHQRLAFVTLDRDQEDLDRFVYRDVVIDGSRYFCLDVRTLAPEPNHNGSMVGILVANT